jgi:hypothetical protein
MKALRKQRKLKKKLKIDSDTDEIGLTADIGLMSSKSVTADRESGGQ